MPPPQPTSQVTTTTNNNGREITSRNGTGTIIKRNEQKSKEMALNIIKENHGTTLQTKATKFKIKSH
jgi:hypothetical protein